MSSKRSHYFGGDKEARIEIIPMIDIMMFLLVFFMVVTLQMIQGAGIKLELPQSSTAQQLETVKVTIGVDKEGGFFLEGQAIAEDALLAKLTELQHSNKVDVVISGDKDTDLQAIVRAMDVVRQSGINAVAIATQA